MLVRRLLHDQVVRLAAAYPVVTIIGPRQSGKSTLAQMAFPAKPYVSLERLEIRDFALHDPQGFLRAHIHEGAILDEIQRAPQLLSELQVLVDAEPERKGLFILTGSHQLSLMRAVTQSLAGRTALVKLLPFSYEERYGRDKSPPPIPELLYEGFYPRISADRLQAAEALAFYVATYVERDVRELLAIRDLRLFSRFLRLCAGRSGQILNLSSLATDTGINHNTARAWLSVLEASFIVTLLPPHHANFNKRLIKAPKLYFWDVGLACYLLGMEEAGHVAHHPLVGALFETWVVTELMKQRLNMVRDPRLFFWRDNSGHEVDLLFDSPRGLVPMEVKLAATVQPHLWKGLDYYRSLNPEAAPALLIYGGLDRQERTDGRQVIGYPHLGQVMRLCA